MLSMHNSTGCCSFCFLQVRKCKALCCLVTTTTTIRLGTWTSSLGVELTVGYRTGTLLTTVQMKVLACAA